MNDNKISKTVVERLPIYLQFLKSRREELGETISATNIARSLKMGEVQVRKDLSAISGAGKPKIGYVVDELIEHLEKFLGYDNVTKAIIVGAGKLGSALLDYQGFNQYGLEILAGFDADESRLGVSASGKQVYSVNDLGEYIKEKNVKIGIISVPSKYAQCICDLMVKCGILAIWNFAPTRLEVPSNILIQNENMATSLALLSSRLLKRIT